MSDYLTCAETAKLVRATLKRAFKGTKFYVRSSTYSGGSSIHVNWTDGPTDDEVRALTYMFEGASFDGMIDLKSYKGPMLLSNEDGTVTEVSSGADYVLTRRDYSDEFMAALVAAYEADYGRPYEPDYYDGGSWASDVLYRFARKSKPGNIDTGVIKAY